jgi:tetratricopeptide (TPR) repeat protein
MHFSTSKGTQMNIQQAATREADVNSGKGRIVLEALKVEVALLQTFWSRKMSQRSLTATEVECGRQVCRRAESFFDRTIQGAFQECLQLQTEIDLQVQRAAERKIANKPVMNQGYVGSFRRKWQALRVKYVTFTNVQRLRRDLRAAQGRLGAIVLDSPLKVNEFARCRERKTAALRAQSEILSRTEQLRQKRVELRRHLPLDIRVIIAVGVFLLMAVSLFSVKAAFSEGKRPSHAVAASVSIKAMSDVPTEHVIEPEKYQAVALKLAAAASSDTPGGPSSDRIHFYVRLAAVDTQLGKKADAARYFAAAKSDAKELPGLGLPNVELENQLGEYAEIADAQTEAGELADAVATLDEGKQSLSHLQGFGGASVMAFAIAQAHAGDFAAARHTESRVSPPARAIQRWSVQAAIAETQAKKGDFRGAIATLNQIADEQEAAGCYAEIVRIQIKAGHLDEAIATVEQAPIAEKDPARIAIVEAQAANGDLAAAKSTADLIKGTEAVEAYAAIVENQVRAGDLAGAQHTADGIHNIFWNKMIHVRIVAAQAELGDVSGASAAAVSFDEDDRSRVNAAIVGTKARAGNVDEALSQGAQISDLYWKRRAYLAIAKAQEHAGQANAAVETIRKSPYSMLDAAEEMSHK